MKKFNFKLQPVLNVREQKEEQIQMELSQLIAQMEIQKQNIVNLLLKRKDTAQQMEKFKSNRIQLEDLMLYQGHINHLDTRIEAERKKLQQISSAIEEVRKRLISASKEKKVIQNLKEKSRESYNFEARRQEINFLDEIAVLQSARRMAAPGWA